MKHLEFGRVALSSCIAAALLAGCGVLRQAQDDMQPPIGAPDFPLARKVAILRQKAFRPIDTRSSTSSSSFKRTAASITSLRRSPVPTERNGVR